MHKRHNKIPNFFRSKNCFHFFEYLVIRWTVWWKYYIFITCKIYFKIKSPAWKCRALLTYEKHREWEWNRTTIPPSFAMLGVSLCSAAKKNSVQKTYPTGETLLSYMYYGLYFSLSMPTFSYSFFFLYLWRTSPRIASVE